jgi:hypothetical protein
MPCHSARLGAHLKTEPHSNVEALQAAMARVVPLHCEVRITVDTATAAFHLSRRPQTLRCWATYGDGPLRPMRVNKRLAWRTEDLRRLLGVAVSEGARTVATAAPALPKSQWAFAKTPVAQAKTPGAA